MKGDSPLMLALAGEPVPLRDCPPGLFLFDGGLGLKVESTSTAVYLALTGEFFWGGANTLAERGKVPVRPIDTEGLERLLRS